MRAAFWPALLLILIPSAGQTQRNPPDSPLAHGPSTTLTDRQRLELAHLDPAGPALVEFFRTRAARPDEERIARSVEALLDAQADVRNTAIRELICQGPAAIPALRRAANDLDHPEAAELARQALTQLEGKPAAELSTAAVHLVRQQRPDGALAALFAFRPFAEDEAVGQEADRAILALAIRGGAVDPAVVRALDDPMPACRAAAVTALCQPGGEAHLPVARRLLADRASLVRLKAAVGLAARNEGEAVPVLIDLVADLPLPDRLEAQQALTRLAGEWALTVPQGGDAISCRLRRETWTSWWKALDGAALLDEIRQRTVSDTDRERGTALLRKLANESPAVREQAVKDLATLGKAAALLLHQAASDPDPRVRVLADRSLYQGEITPLPPLPLPVLRLVAMKKPEGATQVLLAYLPSAENARAREMAVEALAAVALREDKPDPGLLRALEDASPIRRSSAGEVLVSSAHAEHRREARRLLRDNDPGIRLQAALTLVGKGDNEAVPALIDLLVDLPRNESTAAEEFLLRLAGEQAPKVPLGDEPAARHRCRDAWRQWWDEQGPKLEPASPEDLRWLLGQTLVVDVFEPLQRSGRVLELDARGRICWEISGLTRPLDAQVLPGRRVLILEESGQRLAERDLHGVVLWERAFTTQALSFRRFRDGTTGVIFRNQILLLDDKGTSRVLVTRASNDILHGAFLPDRSITLFTAAQQYLRLDDQGRQLSATPSPFPQPWPNGWEFLPEGHILATYLTLNRVAELDAAGKTVWEASVTMPESATRTSNGTTLVASSSGQRIVELDKTGQVVKEIQTGFRPFRARRR